MLSDNPVYTLPDAERMTDALMRVSPDWGLRANLYPKFLEHAGQTVTVQELVEAFFYEVMRYSNGGTDLLGLMVKWIYRLIDDEDFAAAAVARFIRLALYNDDAVLQEFDDYTVTRLLGNPGDAPSADPAND